MTVNTLGAQESRSTRTVAEWLWPFIPMAVSVFSGSALVYYHLYQHVIDAHSPLQRLYAAIYRTFGFAPAVMFFGLTMVWSTIWLAAGRVERPFARLLRLFAMAVMLGVFLNLGDGGLSPEPHKGALGGWLAQTLGAVFGYWPSLLFVWAVTFASLLLATDFFFYESFERLRTPPPPPETGVEAAVTEHFRALAEMTPAPAPSASAAPTAAVAAAAMAAAIEAPESLGSLEQPFAIELPARRRSYAERRAERQAHGSRPASEEIWVAPPENQDIDDPERSAAAANAAAPAAPAEEEDDLLVVPPLADEDFANEDEDDLAVAPANELEMLVSSSRHEPIVFPDDEPTARAAADEAPAAGQTAERAPEVVAEAAAQAAAEPEPEVILEPEAAPAVARDVDSEGDHEGDAEGEGEDEVSAPIAGEPVVNIPRPAAAPEPREPEPEREFQLEPGAEAERAARQRQLFATHLDSALVQEAIELVTSSRRASVAFLQRKLRIDYPLASDVLAELAARGVVALEGDATQGRVLG